MSILLISFSSLLVSMGLTDFHHGDYENGITLIGGSMVMLGAVFSPKRLTSEVTLKNLFTSSEGDEFGMGDIISYAGLFFVLLGAFIIQN